MCALLWCGLLLCCASSNGADTAAGTITCGAPFLLDGLSVPNTATVFAGSQIEVASGFCTIRMPGSGTEPNEIRVWDKSGVTMTKRGFELTHGDARTTGLVPFRIPHTSSEVQFAEAQPGAVQSGKQTTINTQFLDDLWTVNVVAGSAQLNGDVKDAAGDEPYVRFDAGTMISFSPDTYRPGGVYMRVKGCLTKEGDRWFLEDEHLKRKIELLEDKVRKEGQRVGVAASLERLPAGAVNLAARVHVLAEQKYDGKCQPFVPLLTLGGVGVGVSAIPPAVIGGVGLAVPGVLTTTGPGAAPIPASVP